MFSFPSAVRSRLTVISLLVASVSGCSFLRGDGTKQRLDPPSEHPHHPVNAKTRTMLIEITTDPEGVVANVEFKRSSGSDAVDNYVAENLRHAAPGKPSTRSLVELTYSASKGFSEPKLISSAPAP